MARQVEDTPWFFEREELRQLMEADDAGEDMPDAWFKLLALCNMPTALRTTATTEFLKFSEEDFRSLRTWLRIYGTSYSFAKIAAWVPSPLPLDVLEDPEVAKAVDESRPTLSLGTFGAGPVGEAISNNRDAESEPSNEGSGSPPGKNLFLWINPHQEQILMAAAVAAVVLVVAGGTWWLATSGRPSDSAVVATLRANNADQAAKNKALAAQVAQDRQEKSEKDRRIALLEKDKVRRNRLPASAIQSKDRRLAGLQAKLSKGLLDDDRVAGIASWQPLSGAGTAVRSTAPELRWKPVSVEVKVEIFDKLSGKLIWTSKPLKSGTTAVRPTKPLQRGRFYQWVLDGEGLEATRVSFYVLLKTEDDAVKAALASALDNAGLYQEEVEIGPPYSEAATKKMREFENGP